MSHYHRVDTESDDETQVGSIAEPEKLAEVSSHDDIVDGDGYQRSLRWRKAVAFVSLALGLAVNVDALIAGRRNPHVGLLIIQSLCIVILVLPLLFPSHIHLGVTSRPTYIPSSATSCVLLTFLSFISLVTAMWYYWTGDQRGPLSYQLSCSFITFLAAGTMRRGPKRQYRMPPTELGMGSIAYTPGNPMRPVLDFDNSSVLGCYFLLHIASIAAYASKQKQLDESDIPYISAEHRAEYLYAERRDFFDMLEKDSNFVFTEWSLFWCIWKPFLKQLGLFCAACIVEGVLSLSAPWFLHRLIALFESPGQHRSNGYVWCFLMFACLNLTTGVRAWIWAQEHIELHQPARVVMEIFLYSKLLRTKNATGGESRHNLKAKDTKDAGSQILNLFTDDTKQVASLAAHIAYRVFKCTLTVVLGCLLLYNLLSWSAFAGLALVFLGALGTKSLANWQSRINKELYAKRDQRVSAVKELLFSIKVIKLNAWEQRYMNDIKFIRDEELRRLRFWSTTWLAAYGRGLPLICLGAIFASYTLIEGKQLTASTAFVALWIFEIVRSSMEEFPMLIQRYLELRIGLERLVRFMNSREISRSSPSSSAIVFHKATISWPGANDVSTNPRSSLGDVSLELSSGLTVVYGPTASGKTLFLMGILGEADVDGAHSTPWSMADTIPLASTRGRFLSSEIRDSWLTNTVAYSAQTAFIRHGTIKSNILYGQVEWPERYQEVLFACALELTDFPDLDETEIGEGGYNISGGQRARISLARSLYSRARTLLLDDVLRAVDAPTASHIIRSIQPLLKGRTTILVTHHVALGRPFADRVLEINQGCVRLEDVSQAVADWANVDKVEHFEREDSNDDFDKAFAESRTSQKGPRQLVQAEYRKAGRISFRNDYGFVLSSLNCWGIFGCVMITTFFAAQAAIIAEPMVLERWTSMTSDTARTVHYLLLYAAVVGAGLVINVAKDAHVYNGFKRASKVIHDKFMESLMTTSLAFHESVPKGRILNRCADDINQIDSSLPEGFSRAFSSILEIIGSVLMIALNAPLFMITSIIITPLAAWGWKILSNLRSEGRRFNAITQSPLASMYIDTLVSLPDIRAFGAQQNHMHKVLRLLDTCRRGHIWEYYGLIFFEFIARSITSLLVLATGVVLLQYELTAAEAGFVLTFALGCSNGVISLMQVMTDLDVNMVAVERVQEYHHLAPETTSSPKDVPPPDWPSRGAITIRDLRVQYAPDLPEVLHGLNIEIKAGERIGIVGPTGHGKSTLALCLFRAIQYTGRIVIDGVDISTIGLEELRSRLSMIPQEPTLMSGTLRETLDTHGHHSDAEIFDALRQAHLLDHNGGGVFADLESRVEPGGVNFSHGQRQRLCLARAALKPSKVLVFDEFTSSLDYETDFKVTTTLKNSFKGSTVICIAHRLATVVGFDRVLVIRDGRIVEFDSPRKLLGDEGSVFHGMCAANGVEELEKLVGIAMEG